MNESVKPIPTATWSLSLTCYCPKCLEYVDLLDEPDFWDGRQINVCEHGTDRSKDVEVTCPECNRPFKVDLQY